MNIAILHEHPNLADQAKFLSKQLSLALIPNTEEIAKYRILLAITGDLSDYKLELRFPNENINPVFVNFLDQKLQHRKNFGGGRHQAIAKAVGLKRGYTPNLLDGTAGFGKDAFILASLNCSVTMCERNPIIHALLADGLRRLNLSNTAILSSQNLRHQSTQDHLEESTSNYDVIYLDPMYPHRTKSALVKKEMRIVRQLVGDDTDFEIVMDLALKTARNRVVIKRPKSASPIGSIPPSHSIESKKTRFDVYLTQNKT